MSDKISKPTTKRTGSPKPFFLQIQQAVTRGRQSLVCESHHRIQTGPLKDAKVRISIKSDSYDFQSHAVLDIWKNDELKWTRVCNIPYSAMNTPAKLSYNPNAGTHNFLKDTLALLEKAELILK